MLAFVLNKIILFWQSLLLIVTFEYLHKLGVVYFSFDSLSALFMIKRSQ